MSQPPDIDQLAKRFLDLWQDHVAASAADPAVAEWMARLMATPAAVRPDPENQAEDEADADAPSAAGTAALAAAFGARDDGVEQLARRVAACEERLTTLESRLEPGSDGAGRTTRRRRR